MYDTCIFGKIENYCDISLIVSTVLSGIVGSLSNDNGDGNENVISKYKFALF